MSNMTFKDILNESWKQGYPFAIIGIAIGLILGFGYYTFVFAQDWTEYDETDLMCSYSIGYIDSMYDGSLKEFLTENKTVGGEYEKTIISSYYKNCKNEIIQKAEGW